MRIRHNLYLPPELSDTLEMLALRPGTSKSQIVGDALRAYFAARGSREIDEMLRPRRQQPMCQRAMVITVASNRQ